jgi:nicotinamide riboside transporter PnuC
MLRVVVFVLLILLAAPATAYIGPGAGISVLGSLLGILATIVVAIGAIVMWPLRKLLKKKRQKSAPEQEDAV